MPTWESKQPTPEKELWEGPGMAKLRKKGEMLWEGPGMKQKEKKPAVDKEDLVLEMEEPKKSERELLWEGPEMRKKRKIMKDAGDLREEGIIWEPEGMKEKRFKKELSPEDQALLDENLRQIKEDQEQEERLEKLKESQKERLRKSIMSPDELLTKEGYIGAGEDMKRELTARAVNGYRPERPPVPVREHTMKPKGFFKRIWNKLFR